MKLHRNEVAFRGNSKLPDEVTELDTPLKLFSYFFNDSIINMITNETNHAARIENVETKFITNPIESAPVYWYSC